jgi:RNA:NAD 2'-phosphotransferase (TPT1/KptA family)
MTAAVCTDATHNTALTPVTMSKPEGYSMDGRLVRLSKTLCWLLRHGAVEAGVSMDQEGYVSVGTILGLKQFKEFSLDDMLHVVQNNSKKRFFIIGVHVRMCLCLCT